jgi:hypothetical protein
VRHGDGKLGRGSLKHGYIGSRWEEAGKSPTRKTKSMSLRLTSCMYEDE